MDNKKIKIAFFLPNLEGGGVERSVVNLVNNLDIKKYAISLVLGKLKGAFISEISKEVLIIDLNVSNVLGLFFKLVKYFRGKQPDIFISALPHINIFCIIAKIISREKTRIILMQQTLISLLSLTARDFFRRSISRFLLPFLIRVFYPQADAIICASKGVARDILKIISCPEKIKVIYNSIVEKRINLLAQEFFQHPWFSQKEIPIILAVGRLVRAKDYPTLFRAFKQVLSKKFSRLVILGEGPEEKKLKDLSQNLDISENIAFLGFQENPYRYMRRASVFVLSSLREGFGYVVVEAMACGLPVVSTDCVGPKEIIENENNGILVPVADQEALAKAILKVLDNPFLAHKLSEQGKKRADYFSIEKSVKKYEEVFDNL